MPWPKGGKFLIAAASILVGFSFVLLLKAHGFKGSQVMRPEAALASLVQIEQENQQLANDNNKLSQELAKFSEGQNASALTLQQLQQAQINAGLTSIKGPGLRIILDDAQNRDVTQEDPYNYVIHEEYIRQLVNILWNGGALAVSINGQRVMSGTEVFCSGAFIQINETRQMPPYVIEAVGDVRSLQSALQFYFWDRLGEYQKLYGITRRLEIPNEQITIPAGKPKTYKYAEPIKEGK